VVAGHFASVLDEELAGRPLSPAARSAVEEARRETLARVSPARAGPQVAQAVEEASVAAFHLGIGIAATLVALGGVLGAVAIRNPRRAVRCEDCAGGQLAGQPADAGRDRLPVIVLPRARRRAPTA